MSLVYEALQKAEREKERKAGTPPAPAPVVPKAEPPPPAPAATPQTVQRFAGILTLVLVIAATILYFVTTRSTPPAEPAAVSATPTPPAPAPVTSPAPPIPAARVPNSSTYKLTGIMQRGDAFDAVINGRIVSEEQYVEGAIVKKIERDRVTLAADGREIIVRLD